MGVETMGRTRVLGFLSVALLSAVLVFYGVGAAFAQPPQRLPINPDTVARLQLLNSITVKGKGTPGIMGIGLNENGQRVALAMRDRSIRVWDWAGNDELIAFTGHERPVRAVAFLNETTVVSASEDRTMRAWSIANGQELRSSGPGRSAVNTLAVSPNGVWLVTGDEGGLVGLWEAKTGNRVNNFKGHSGETTNVAFGPDSKLFASVGQDGVIVLWSAETKSEVAKLRGANGPLVAVAFSPDRLVMAAGQRGGGRSTVYLWDVNKQERLTTLTDVGGGLSGLAFSPDASLLAIGTANATIEFWDTFTNQLVGRVAAPDAPGGVPASGVTFNADGTLIGAITGPERVSIWGVR
jgi:WD40 repeat protein